MPYSGVTDTSLPAAVKRLPKALREVWIKVFNQNYDTRTEEECFRIAWGVVKKLRSAKKARLLAGVDVAAVRSWLDPGAAPEEADMSEPQLFHGAAGFKAYQQTDGRTRWLMLTSGAFEDRDGEIMSQEWLESALAFAEKSGQRGTLNFWHQRNTDLGICDRQALIGDPGFLLETGVFDDTPAGRKAAAYYREHAEENAGSIEFLWTRRTSDKVYLAPGVIVRRSVLPRDYAAFPYSSMLTKELTMPQQRPEVIAEFAKMLEITDAQAAAMLEHLESGAKQLQDYGIRWKEADAAEEPAAPVLIDTPLPDSQPEPQSDVKETDVVAEPSVEPAAVSDTPVEPVEAVEVVLAPEAMTSLAAQAAEVLRPVLDALNTQVAQLAEALVTLTGWQQTVTAEVKEMQTTVGKLATTDDEKIAAAVRNLPRATVKTLNGSLQRPTQRTETAPAPVATEESMAQRALKTLYG